MGGKNTDIDGYMPKAVSRDGGKSWTVEKTPFAAQGSNQRPSILRLKSGRLLFVGDFQHISGKKPEAIEQNGSYVALSDDDGATWKIRKLIGTQQHEDPNRHGGHPTIGYSVVRQAPNGMIHLITTMNRPCLHFEINEAWILSGNLHENTGDDELMRSQATAIRNVKKYAEYYASGEQKIVYSGGIADDGHFLLHGEEVWYFQNGDRHYQAFYRLGQKIGDEILRAADGTTLWIRQHRQDGTSTITRYWSDGGKRSQSTWKKKSSFDSDSYHLET
jgi:hypothetical protein